MNKGLDAIRQYKQATCPHCQYYYGNKCNNEYECFSTIVEKDLIRLEELEKAFDALSKDDEKAKKELSKEIERVRTLRLIKDKQYYALSTISDIIRDFNKGEFASAEIALQEITSLLSEVLL